MFNRNITNDCHIGCDIGANTMFTYFYDNVSGNDDYFLHCDIPFNGGVSNGIYCNHNTIIGNKISAIKINYNQSIYIDSCDFSNTLGNKIIDIVGCSDGSITNCKLTGNVNSTAIDARQLENINIANNLIDTCNIGIKLSETPNRRDVDVILGNVINATIPISLNYVNDIKICDNYILNNVVEEQTINIIKNNNQTLTQEKLQSERQKQIANTQRSSLYNIYDNYNENTYNVIEAGPYNLKDIIENLTDNNAMTIIELTSDRTVVDETIEVNGHKNFIIKGKSSRQNTIETSNNIPLFEGTNEGDICFVDVAICGSTTYPNIKAVNIDCNNQGTVSAYRIISYNIGTLFEVNNTSQANFLFIRNFLVQNAIKTENGTNIYVDGLLNSYQCGRLVYFDFVSNSTILNCGSCGANQTEITLGNCNNILLKTSNADAGYNSNEALLITNCEDITIYDSWFSSSNFDNNNLPTALNRNGINIIDSTDILIQCNQLINNKYGLYATNCFELIADENKGEANLTYDFYLYDCENSSLSYNSDVSYALRNINPEFKLDNCSNIYCIYNSITHEENEEEMLENCENIEFNNIFNVCAISLNDFDLINN